jgi:hypothetical protein
VCFKWAEGNRSICFFFFCIPCSFLFFIPLLSFKRVKGLEVSTIRSNYPAMCIIDKRFYCIYKHVNLEYVLGAWTLFKSWSMPLLLHVFNLHIVYMMKFMVREKLFLFNQFIFLLRTMFEEHIVLSHDGKQVKGPNNKVHLYY